MTKKILVVDDEPSLLRLLQMTLETEGYDVVLASDGQTAVTQVQNERPDLMLLDVMMPVVDGWGVLELLKSSTRRPRVICLTAKSDRRDLARGFTLGADDYLPKPFDIEDLLALVDTVLKRSPAEQEERRRTAIAELEG